MRWIRISKIVALVWFGLLVGFFRDQERVHILSSLVTVILSFGASNRLSISYHMHVCFL